MDMVEVTDYTPQDAALAQTQPSILASDEVMFGGQVDRAVAAFESARHQLYRPDGSLIYGEQEHKERVAALFGELDKKIDPLVQTLESSAAKAEQERAVARRDPVFGLNSIDAAKANSLAVFVAEDCASLPLDALLERVASARAAGDSAEKILTLRYAAQRLRTERAQADRKKEPQSPEMRALAVALDDLDAQLRPADMEQRETKATEARRDVARLRAYAGQQRRRLDGSAATEIAQMRQRLGSRL